MKSRLEQLQDFLDGSADEETLARIEAELRDPASDLRGFLEVARQCAEQFGPTDIDWPQLLEPDDDEDASATESPDVSESSSEPFGVRTTLRREGDRNGTGTFWSRRLSRDLAVAAALLVCGALAGRFLLPAGGGPQGVQLVSAQATPTRVPERGPNDLVPAVEVLSEMSGFATMVSLAPHRSPIVYPSLGGDDYPVSAGNLSEPIRLPKDTTAAVFVVTETPSGEPLRNAEDGLRQYRPGDEERVREALQRVLEEKGYRRMAFGEASFTTGN